MVVCEKEIVKIIDTAQRILIIMIAKNIINSQYTMNRAVIFPGQGSQSVGMGKDFFDSEKAARLVFESVDDVLGYKLSEIIFNGWYKYNSLYEQLIELCNDIFFV